MKKIYNKPQTEWAVTLETYLMQVSGSRDSLDGMHPGTSAPMRSAEMALPANANGMPQLL